MTIPGVIYAHVADSVRARTYVDVHLLVHEQLEERIGAMFQVASRVGIAPEKSPMQLRLQFHDPNCS